MKYSMHCRRMEEFKSIRIQMLVLQKQKQEQQWKQQKKFLELLLNKTLEERMSDSFTPDAVTNSINKFIYYPDDGTTFPAYYRRYKGIFEMDCSHWNDEESLLIIKKIVPHWTWKTCEFYFAPKNQVRWILMKLY